MLSATVAITAEFSESASATVSHEAQAQFDTAFTQGTIATKLHLGEIDTTANFAQQTTALVDQFTSVEFESEFSITVAGDDFDFAEMSIQAAFTQTTVAGVITGAQADFDTEFAQSVSALNLKISGGDFDGVFAQTTAAETTVETPVDFVGEFGQVTGTRVIGNARIDLELFATQITIGRELRPDPYRKSTVDTESRILKVYAEPRSLVVEPETRVEKVNIPPYNAEYTRRVA